MIFDVPFTPNYSRISLFMEKGLHPLKPVLLLLVGLSPALNLLPGGGSHFISEQFNPGLDQSHPNNPRPAV